MKALNTVTVQLCRMIAGDGEGATKLLECSVCGAKDEETAKTINEYFTKYSYIPDTHTAVALNVYENYVKNTGDKTVSVIASTANPFKFNEAVISAISPETDLSGKDEFELLDILASKGNIEIPQQLKELKSKKIRFSQVCDKNDMRQETDKFLS